MARRGARLGQHFLTGQWAAAALVEAAGVRPGEIILEIGPGKGALTRELLKTGARVVAIEKDEALVAQLRETFAQEIQNGQLTVVSKDIRNFDPRSLGAYIVAANIPYYITGEIIRQFLETRMQPRAVALLVQKEVAQRIATGAKESILSLSVKAYGCPKLIAKVPRGNFSPPPSVDSAILLVDNISKEFFDGISEKAFFDCLHAGFASKRKFLANNLGVKFGKEEAARALAACGINAKARAEDVPLATWKCLVKNLAH